MALASLTTTVVMLLATSTAHAQPAERATAPIAAAQDSLQSIVLTVSGGISLGSYQAGVNWALIEFLRTATHDDAYRARYAKLREDDTARLRAAIDAATQHPNAAGSFGLSAMSLPAGRSGTSMRPLTRFSLTSVAGASAGNINGVLSALAWCERPTGEDPEKSLFWRTWVPTGWEQLFPGDGAFAGKHALPRSDTLALFTRRFFATHLYPAIEERMRRDSSAVACDVPLGITVTRLVPDIVEVRPAITASTQRFAAIMTVKRDIAAKSPVIFRQPDKSLRLVPDALGSVIALASNGSDTIATRAVFGLVEASSAFPVAFAPKLLHYYPLAKLGEGLPTCARLEGPGPKQCLAPDSARFLDGGVFDNNPLDLAIQLDRRHRCDKPLICSKPGPQLIYIDPDAFRGDLLSLRRTRAPAEASGGLAAFFVLVAGAIPSARQYELQILKRTLARSTESATQQPRISATDRAHPIAGEHLSAFGAFLGRPLREHDFYAGMYDGFRFVAREFLCLPADRVTAVIADACVRERLKELIAGRHVPVGATAPHVMSALYALEHPSDRLMPNTDSAMVPADSGLARSPAAVAKHREHIRVLRSLVHANALLLTTDADRACRRGPSIASGLFCRDSFGVVLDEFATPETQRTVRRWANECRVTTRNARIAQARTRSAASARARAAGIVTANEPAPDSYVGIDECLADTTFARLLEDRDGFATATVTEVLRRLWAVENAYKTPSQNYEEVAQALEFFNYASADAARRGPVFDPSSIPRYDRRAFVTVLRQVPNYIAPTIGTSGFALGWRPSYYIRRGGVALTVPIDVFRLHVDVPDRKGRTSQAAIGPGIAIRPPRVPASIVSRVQVSTQWSGDLAHEPVRFKRSRFTGELSANVLAGRMRLGVRTLPARLDAEPGSQRRSLVYSAGMADVNGLLYWLLAR